jgi:flavin-dependent dehydrogenase
MDREAIRRRRVAIVGGGVGGLFAAKRLGRAADVEVIVIAAPTITCSRRCSIKSPECDRKVFAK